MPAFRYRILFQGTTLPAFTPQQVQPRLALLSQQAEPALDVLFSGEPFWVQENLTGRAAIAYQQRLAEIGAYAEIYRQDSDIEANVYALTLLGVQDSEAKSGISKNLGWSWWVGTLSLLLALSIWLLLFLLTPSDSPPAPNFAASTGQAALEVPALRRHFLPAKPATPLTADPSSPPALEQPLPHTELAQFQRSWYQRLRADVQLLQGDIQQRNLLLPLPDFLTQITGELPNLSLQRQNERIQLRIPYLQQVLNQGVDRLEWQGLQGYLMRQDKGWQLHTEQGDFKLAVLQHGWVSLSTVQIEAQLNEALLPNSLRFNLPHLEISDGVQRELRLNDLGLDVNLLHQGETLPIAQGVLHSKAVLLRHHQQHLSWANALLMAAAQIHEKTINYALHLRLDEVQASQLTAFALPENLQAVQATVLLRDLPLLENGLSVLPELIEKKGKIPTFSPQNLPQETRANLHLHSPEGSLEAQFTVRLKQNPQTPPPQWQDWLPLLDIALDLECDQHLLAALWQRYSGSQEPLPLGYLQFHGYVRNQANNYLLHLRWQDQQLYLNDMRIGGYAEYQLAQQQRQLSEAFSLLAGLQSTLEIYYHSRGHFPTDIQRLNVQTQGLYTDNIRLDQRSLVVQADLKTGAGIRLQFFPEQDRWQCQTEGEALPVALLPAWCR